MFYEVMGTYADSRVAKSAPKARIAVIWNDVEKSFQRT